MFQILEYWYRTKGPIIKVRFPLGKPDTLFVKNPEAMKTVYDHDGKYPINGVNDFNDYYRHNMAQDLFPDTGGLGGSRGREWHEFRSKVQRDMMRPKSAFFYIGIVEEISYELQGLISKSLDENQEVDDLLELINRWATESITAIFLDIRLNYLNNDLAQDSEAEKLIDAIKVLTGPDGQNLAMGPSIWKYFPTPSFRRFDKAVRDFTRMEKNIIDKALSGMKKREDKTDAELSLLEKLINRCGPDSPVPLLMSQDAIVAGVETTGTTAAFLLLDLARNSDKQEILYQEIVDTIGDGDITEPKLKQMKYLKACFRESQRMNPAVLGSCRITQEDMVLEGYKVPKGVTVIYSLMLAMRDPELFPDSDRFLPERWLRGNPLRHKSHPFATTIFGHGPRMCIGRRFAELECYIITIKVLQRFKLEYHHQHVGVAVEFVNKPDRKIRMRFISRK